MKETFKKYWDPCTIIPGKILDVHVAVTLGISYEINEKIDHLTTWPNLRENFITTPWCPCPTVVRVDAGLPAEVHADIVKVAPAGGNVQCSTTEDDCGP
jgi:hypothetical protein